MNRTIGTEGKKYTLKSRVPVPEGKIIAVIYACVYIDIIRIITKQAIPGPGSYEPKTNLDKHGVYFVSNLE